ncbi:small subunit rRNA processing factor, putative [Plasmodium malariae]|uniref:Small subunit rRNA processing factor, putative n=1 Tax=Plasmodium malariae TaxID=5858 RepID=A0A1C3L2Y1_PLAMA|nr:small subunit rRNA processing factor, putative [Plasmodium malariae]
MVERKKEQCLKKGKCVKVKTKGAKNDEVKRIRKNTNNLNEQKGNEGKEHTSVATYDADISLKRKRSTRTFNTNCSRNRNKKCSRYNSSYSNRSTIFKGRDAKIHFTKNSSKNIGVPCTVDNNSNYVQLADRGYTANGCTTYSDDVNDDVDIYSDYDAVDRGNDFYIYNNNSSSSSENENLGTPDDALLDTPDDTPVDAPDDTPVDAPDDNLKGKENNNIKYGGEYISYDEYINVMKNCKQGNDVNIKREDVKEDLNNDEGKKMYKIFLLFSPLGVTSINNKSYIINADDHMSLFENKLKSVERLIEITKNNKEKKNLEKKMEMIKNKQDNLRLDILFFTLLSLRDSVINKKKKLQIYIHTIRGLLIYVSPSFRVPRNFMVFKKIMLQLLKNRVVTDNDKKPLMSITHRPINYFVGSSVCVGISNKGFPTDIKKFSEKIIETNNDYSFFLSLSNMHDLSYFIEMMKKKESENFSLDYFVRLSDLKLSAITICSKLTHFLN